MKIVQTWWMSDEIWNLTTNYTKTIISRNICYYKMPSSTQDSESGLSIKEVEIVCQYNINNIQLW